MQGSHSFCQICGQLAARDCNCRRPVAGAAHDLGELFVLLCPLQQGAEVHRDRDLMQAFDSADKPRKDCNFTSSFRFEAHVQVHFGVDKTGDHFKLEVTSRSQQS